MKSVRVTESGPRKRYQNEGLSTQDNLYNAGLVLQIPQEPV